MLDHTVFFHLILLEIRYVGIDKFQLLNFGHFFMNCKGSILINGFGEGRFIARICDPQCSLVNVIDFIIQCHRMKYPYQGTIIEL